MPLERKVIVWCLDAGVEELLAVSLGSLKVNAPQLWERSPKVVVDCGLSEPFRHFLHSLEGEGIYISSPPSLVNTDGAPGIDALRQRVRLSEFASSLPGVKPGDHLLSCDADTVFLQELDTLPLPLEGTDLAVMPGYTISKGCEIPTPWLRAATLVHADLEDADFAYIARQLKLSEEELHSITSYNAGVFSFYAGQCFSKPWLAAYNELRQVIDTKGRPAFTAFMTEQNALSLCVHRGQICVTELPRRFNQFPPIKPLPLAWPIDTVIVHFVNFQMNHRKFNYSLYYTMRRQLVELGFLSSDSMGIASVKKFGGGEF